MIYFILLVLGLCLGSFVNALVWRLHEQSKPKKKRAASAKELSITKGRSMCPGCKHTLMAADLIPVVSWLFLRGRCRYCKKPISWQYPIVETITGLLFIVSYYFWPVDLSKGTLYWLQFGVWLVAIVVSLALVIYDFKWMLLPNRLVFILAAFGLVYALLSLITDVSTIVDILLAVGISGGIFWLLFQISDGKWIGGGDVKLGLALGLFIPGAVSAFLMLFLASFVASMFVVFLIIIGKYKKGIRIPFGPFLLLGTFLVVIFGLRFSIWYENLFLL